MNYSVGRDAYLADFEEVVAQGKSFRSHAIQTSSDVVVIWVCGVEVDVWLQLPAFAGLDVGQSTGGLRQ